MIKTAQDYLIKNWDRLGLNGETPKKLSFLGISGTNRENGRVSFLVFADRIRNPLFVIKTCRNPNGKESLNHEFKNLSEIYSRVPDSLKSSIPKPLLIQSLGPDMILIESYLDGERLTPQSGRISQDFKKATEWLIDFGNATKGAEGRNGAYENIKNKIDSFSDSINLKSEDKATLVGYFEGNTLQEAPFVSQHGDFWYENILTSDRGLRVLDWEFSKISGLPLFDFFHFTIMYDIALGRITEQTDYLRKFKKAFFSKNSFSDLVKEHVVNYCSNLDLDSDFIETFFLAYLLQFAMMEDDGLLSINPFISPDERIWGNFMVIFLDNRNSFILK